ncbi:MAG: YibE/F family protein [Pseudomonadales bacterium]|jgi:uncharacterized membrane protein|nr:YibE/F family protein [Pseudomonadales bacterium]
MSQLIEVRVLSVPREEPIEVNNVEQTLQELEVEVLTGDKAGEVLILRNGDIPMTRQNIHRAGERLMVSYSDPSDLNTFHIVDYVRRTDLELWAIIFIIVTLAITRKQGLMALVSLAFTFFIIFQLTLPMIMGGNNPFLVSLLTVTIIIPVTFYISHGFKRKTHVAAIGTVISLFITIILAHLAVDGANLTGYTSDEASFIFATLGDLINMRGLLLAGIVIGSLGVINDVTIAQATLVEELKKGEPKLKFKELYLKSMKVGRAHIVSMVDTLVLTYAGASLPLLILLIDGHAPLMQVLNYEIIAEEIVRTLVGSIGLMLAVPITTIIAAAFNSD